MGRRSAQLPERLGDMPVTVPLSGMALVDGDLVVPVVDSDVSPAAIRREARKAFAPRLAFLSQVADGALVVTVRTEVPVACTACGAIAVHAGRFRTQAAVPDRLKAVDLLGRYGVGHAEGIDADEVREKLERTFQILADTLEPAMASRVQDAIVAAWAA